MSLRLLRARRSFEVLEARIAPSDTLLVLGAAIAAARPETMPIAPPSPATPRQPWAPEKMEVAAPSPSAPTHPEASTQVTADPEAIDDLFRDDLDLAFSIQLGESLGPDLPPAESTSPRPAGPLSLGIGTAPSPAPGSGSSGSAGGSGGGGGGGSPSPSQALTATTDVAHAAAPAPNTSGAMSPMDSGPVAVDDYYQVAHDDVFSDNVLTNDSGTGTVYLDSLPTLGTVSMDSGGGFTYQGGYHNYGTDSFTYHFVDDMTGESSNVATVTIDVLEHPPVANPDTYTLQHDQPFHVDALGSTPGVLSNDTDPDPQMETMTATLVTAPANGTLVLYSDGSFDYTPKAGEVGTETFTYKNTDALGESSDATVTLNIVDPNRPVALDDGVDPSGNVIWQTSWRKSQDIQSSFSGNVLVNQYGTDYDDDPMDTITPIADPPPAGGTLQLTHDANGNWTGDFTFTPDVGFSGIYSFTYHVNDKAEDSNTATVYIRVQKVDLDMWDGGDWNDPTYAPKEVPDALELSRGAFTVANLNDTNGDGTPDYLESPVAATETGRADVDLMKIVVNQPVPLIPRLNTVALSLTPYLELWRDSSKSTPYPHSGDSGSGENTTIDVSLLPMTLWVEAPVRSQSLQDMGVMESYNNVSDLVHVTAIWAIPTAINANQSANQVFNANNPGLNSTSTPGPWIAAINGTGVIPIDQTQIDNTVGVRNAILIKYSIVPAIPENPNPFLQQRWEDWGVKFDDTRKVEANEWVQNNVGGPYVAQNDPVATMPAFSEKVNDDDPAAGEADQSARVYIDTNGNYFYGYDAPGYPRNYPPPGTTPNEYISQLHAFQFLRVSFNGNAPAGGSLEKPAVAGSACSAPIQWWEQSSVTTTTVMINGQAEDLYTRQGAQHASFIGPNSAFTHLGPPFDF